MSSGIYNIGLTALLTYQRSLEVTANNIANASTPGYSRQTALLSAIPGGMTPVGRMGAGVELSQIRRNVDQFLISERIFTASSLGSSKLLATLADSLEGLIGPDGVDLGGPMYAFTSALEDLANDPTSLPARTEALARAKALADRFQLMDKRLEDLRGEVNGRVRAIAGEINGLSSQIADLNRRIAEASVNGPPNDLLDQRDEAIRRLAELVDIQVVDADRNVKNVSTGKGLNLVLGAEAATLSVTPSPFDPAEVVVSIESGGNVLPIENSIGGGALGGALAFTRDVLNPVQNQFGRQALALATLFNAQQQRGLDLDGNRGQALFGAIEPEVLPSSDNANPGSTATVVAIEDLAALGTDDYELSFDGASWRLENLRTGSNVPLVPDGGDFLAEGLRITVDPAAVAGDRFLLRPTRGGAGDLAVLLEDPARLAAAGALSAVPAAANAGAGAISDVEVLDPANPALLDAVRIEFDSATTFTVNGGPPQAYTPGEDIVVNGWRVRISGAPAAGDVFDVTGNAGAVGNGANALALSALNREGVFDGGTLSLAEAQAQIISGVGSQARTFATSAQIQEGLMASVDARLAESQGVNLDEEAVKLQQLQQAYGAAAEIFSVANELFETLIRSVSR